LPRGLLLFLLKVFSEGLYIEMPDGNRSSIPLDEADADRVSKADNRKKMIACQIINAMFLFVIMLKMYSG
jgi:hypothetical protein